MNRTLKWLCCLLFCTSSALAQIAATDPSIRPVYGIGTLNRPVHSVVTTSVVTNAATVYYFPKMTKVVRLYNPSIDTSIRYKLGYDTSVNVMATSTATMMPLPPGGSVGLTSETTQVWMKVSDVSAVATQTIFVESLR